jgi:hypothetical protein
METTVRPVGHTGDISMLHRVEMNIVDMPFEVALITNSVFPIPALPDALFALRDLAL